MNLWRLARFWPEGGNREAILASCEAFDRCLRAAEEAADDPVLRPEYLAGSVTSALRRKYGNTRRARQRIGDTHEIEANQPVRVRLGPSRTTFESFVLNVRTGQPAVVAARRRDVAAGDGTGRLPGVHVVLAPARRAL